MQFRIATAQRSSSRARIALCGPAGSGKTFTALELARGLTDEHHRIVLIDTENGSAAKYADGKWKQLPLPDYRLETYAAAIKYAEEAASVLIIDSISHAWAGPGGALEMVEDAQKKVRNKMEAWRMVTPMQNRFVAAMVNCKAHLIVTMRTKTDWTFEEDARGRKVPRKVGTKPIQREGIEYEFDIVGDLSWEHDLIVSKPRCPQIDCLVVPRPGADLGRTIRAWLSDRVVVPTQAPGLAEPDTPAVTQALDSESVKGLLRRMTEEAIESAAGARQVLEDAGLDRHAAQAALLQQLAAPGGDGPITPDDVGDALTMALEVMA